MRSHASWFMKERCVNKILYEVMNSWKKYFIQFVNTDCIIITSQTPPNLTLPIGTISD